MRVLLVNRHYGGEQVPTGRMLRDVAIRLVHDGHEVRVLTTRNGYRGTAGAAHAEAGVAVTYVPTFGIKWRPWCWAIFWLAACVSVPIRRWDRCLILTDPPFMAIAAWLARHLYRTGRNAYLWTMDLYPEALVAGGVLQEKGCCHRLLRRLNELGLGSADGVVCLGEQQRRRRREYRNWREEPGSSIVVPPWDYRAVEKVVRKQNRFLAKYGLQRRKVALYAGNLGKAHGFLEVLAAAQQLQAEEVDDWMFVFVVRGAGVEGLKAASIGLSNVLVTDYQPAEMTADMLWAADVHLVTMQEAWQGIVIPSKLYEILRTDSPVLYIGPKDSDTANEIRRHGAGITLQTECSPLEVISALRELDWGPWHRPTALAADGADEVARFLTAHAWGKERTLRPDAASEERMPAVRV